MEGPRRRDFKAPAVAPWAIAPVGLESSGTPRASLGKVRRAFMHAPGAATPRAELHTFGDGPAALVAFVFHLELASECPLELRLAHGAPIAERSRGFLASPVAHRRQTLAKGLFLGPLELREHVSRVAKALAGFEFHGAANDGDDVGVNALAES